MNKYTFFTSVIILTVLLIFFFAIGLAYKAGLDKGRMDNKPSWIQDARNKALQDIGESVGYFVSKEDLRDDLIRINPLNPKSIGVYLYEVNGVRTILTVCHEPKCIKRPPPGYTNNKVKTP